MATRNKEEDDPLRLQNRFDKKLLLTDATVASREKNHSGITLSKQMHREFYRCLRNWTENRCGEALSVFSKNLKKLFGVRDNNRFIRLGKMKNIFKIY